MITVPPILMPIGLSVCVLPLLWVVHDSIKERLFHRTIRSAWFAVAVAGAAGFMFGVIAARAA
ncbi:hypothetical protein [Acidovorax phage ACPWH]|nr:hypothetical protein [Acidovorax phage ACPWH]QXV72223.1 hypothetical protein Acf1_00026 [Acidovorax phage ACF1]